MSDAADLAAALSGAPAPALASKGKRPRPRWRRWLRRGLLGVGALLALIMVILAIVLVAGWTAFGHRAEGARRARIEKSPQWRDGSFVNPQPLRNDGWGMVKGMLDVSPHVSPATGQAPAAVAGDRKRFQATPATGLRVTWMGHSTTLVEIDGHRVLTDPVFGERASPLGWVGPRRWYAPPVALAELPPIDAVVVSHDHYDHLDHDTVKAMAALVATKAWNATFVVPLGMGAHLEHWGVPAARIVELDWWERWAAGGLAIVCTPARHASGRMLLDNDATLWAGFAFIGDRHRVYFSGDTGLFPALREVGARLGPFDLTMIEVGQYDRAWPDWHSGPEQAVIAHGMVGGRVLLPIHWGLFTLAYHGWTEPIERALVAARAAGTSLVVPRPGESIEPAVAAAAPVERWWPELPWKTAAQHPIVSTQVGEAGGGGGGR
jgi:L-ascorbate metabolism protein UlaG (beta-lactamase superfamily)